MRLLVLGGTVFLSAAVAAEAVARGHEVTCACRGESGSVPDGARLVRWDRTTPPSPSLVELVETTDAVVDIARHPSRVRSAVAAFPDAHWVFVSTVNVYVDEATPGGRPDTLALHEPIRTDEDPTTAPEVYGAMKVACEQIVAEGAVSSMVVRPGLIVGPDDPTGRFTYWPERLTETGEVLAPGRPTDSVQVIDVRDLAAWIVDGAEARLIGVYDGVGPATGIGALLAEVAAGVGTSLVEPVETTLTWVDQDFLEQQGVEPWAGDRGVPLWLPRPAYDGMLAHDAAPSLDAGLVPRPVAETARDTLAWLRATPAAARTGITRDDEQAVLAAWHEREQ